MKGCLLVIACLSWSCSVQGFWLDLDLEIDTALKRNEPFDGSRNSGPYIRDSFRKEVLNPSLDKIVRAIRTIKNSDERNEGILLGLIVFVTLALGYLGMSVKYQRKGKGKMTKWTKSMPGDANQGQEESFIVKTSSA